MTAPTQRPALSRHLSGAELQRWYWLRDELATFARSIGVRASGSKEALTARVAAALDGREIEERPARSSASPQLVEPLHPGSVIPVGQRCSQVVRAWLSDQLGHPYRFDAAMRSFFAEGDGTRTLQDALAHHRTTRSGDPKPIDRQFEYNRFTRAWHAEHPGGSRSALMEAWRAYRATPVDVRDRA